MESIISGGIFLIVPNQLNVFISGICSLFLIIALEVLKIK